MALAKRTGVVAAGVAMPVDTGVKISPFGAFPETELTLAEYPQFPMMGSLALVLTHEGEDVCVATVNPFPADVRPLDDNQVWLKGWGENEGVPEALEKAGVVTRTGEKSATGFAEAELAVVSEAVMEKWRAAHPEVDEENEEWEEMGPF
ncbi:hypothetical protein [Hyphomicrobium sp. DY-1]|uniref:hypothetical protein n=1 Tax=Hyphomicrobium sp. DY-1 TaxID=3075650 RepID=UPI0039C15380